MAREDIPREAQRAHIRHAILGAGHAQQPGLAHRAGQADHAGFGIVLIGKLFGVQRGPGLHLRGPSPMPRLEERPVEEGCVGHQSPLNTGRCLATKAS
ncbi:hypothetical protein J4558_09005 [Leptolyngbya sp. 15MV]|nr:hypothetical protein J4558_09005 [Leptolyngbya sp. 15MV]